MSDVQLDDGMPRYVVVEGQAVCIECSAVILAYAPAHLGRDIHTEWHEKIEARIRGEVRRG